MAKVVDPNAMAANWLAGMKSQKAQDRYKAGTANPKRDPIAAAASPAGMAAYEQGCAASVANGRRQAGLAKWNGQSWAAACAAKGASRLGTGAQASAAVYQNAAIKLAQAAQQGSAAAAAVTDPLEKVRANINAFKAAFGKAPI
jgi:hypothetical protein